MFTVLPVSNLAAELCIPIQRHKTD